MEQKSTFSKLIDSIKPKIPNWIKASAPSIAAKIFGKSKGITLWLTKTALTFLYKKLKPEIEAWQYKLDKKKLDQTQVKEYEKLKDEGASSEELKKKRLDLINGRTK